MIVGNANTYGSQYIGLYSKIEIGDEVQMIRTKDGQPLWQGHHVTSFHGGSIPLSPVGLATGLLDAAMNVEEEQKFRIVDDLAGADSSILLAIALNPTNTKYLNGLGFLNSLRGHHERALAAYQRAVDRKASCTANGATCGSIRQSPYTVNPGPRTIIKSVS